MYLRNSLWYFAVYQSKLKLFSHHDTLSDTEKHIFGPEKFFLPKKSRMYNVFQLVLCHAKKMKFFLLKWGSTC